MNDPQAPIAIGPDRLCWDGSRPRGRCRDWSCIDALFFTRNTSSRAVLHFRWVSRVTARCHWHVDQRHGRCQWRVAARHHGVGVRADVCLSEMSLDECEPCELRRSGAAAQLHDGEVELVGSGLACSDQQRGSGDYGRKRRAMVGRVARAIEAWASTV